MNIKGGEKLTAIASNFGNNIDVSEAAAAKAYFGMICPGLNRRTDTPLNNRLNYGYAVIRNAIIRAMILKGLHPSFGLHHHNRYNAFNMADDLIEPWRPMVDLIAFQNVGTEIVLSRAERRELALVLHNACRIAGRKVSILTGIDMMTGSLKDAIMSDIENDIVLPEIIRVEQMEAVIE